MFYLTELFNPQVEKWVWNFILLQFLSPHKQKLSVYETSFQEIKPCP